MSANIESIFGGAFVPVAEHTMQDPGSVFLARLQSAGLIVDHLVPNELQRTKATDSKGSAKPMWYVWHPGEVAGGCWGDWRKGSMDTWFARSGGEITPLQRQRQQAQIDAAKRKQAEAQAAAAEVADTIYDSAGPADPNHPYLSSKGVKPLGGVRQSGDRIVLPAINSVGEVTTIQTIGPDGSKMFHKGGKFSGSWFTIPGATSTIYVAEGYATAASIHAATGHEVVVAFNAQNMVTVAPLVREKYAGRIIFAADNDRFSPTNTGIKAAANAASAIGATYIAPTFKGESGTDFNDLHACEGIDAVRAQVAIVEQAFPLSRVDSLQVKEIDWLVEGYIESDSLAVIFGEPGCGKSFIAISLACAIATGTPWYGRKVRQGAVIYIAGEGHNGLARRFRAWEIGSGHSLSGVNLFKSHKSAPLIDAAALQQVIESIDALGVEVAAIFVDTLARNYGGDENSTQDMSAYIANLDVLRHRYHCFVGSVHHSGKASPGQARGSTALRGAMDAEYSVDRDEVSGIIVFTNKKMKDGEVPSPVQFSIKSVGLGVLDSGGCEITGGYLESVDLSEFIDATKLSAEYMGKNQRKALEALERLAYAHKDVGGLVTLDDWREACDMDRNRFKEAKDSLIEKKIISIIGNEVRLSTSQRRPNSASETI